MALFKYRKLSFIFIVISYFTCQQTYSQQYQFTRGADPGELYIVSFWKNYQEFQYKGLFHSTDNGETIEVLYSSDIINQDTMHVLGIISDVIPGTIYNHAYFNNYELFISTNYGSTWDTVLQINNLSNRYLSGIIPGEIYSIDTIISISYDYGVSFELFCDDYYNVYDLGKTPGTLLARSPNAITIFLLNAYNYTCEFDTVNNVDSIIGNHYVTRLVSGAKPGEIYMLNLYALSQLEFIYDIYFSADTGHTFEHRYTSDIFNYQAYDFYQTAGREDGSYYICKLTLDYSIPAWVMIIDYSSDYAKTFTTYHHILDETVNTKLASDSNSSNFLTFFPNPANEYLIVNCLNLSKRDVVIEIYDLFGRRINKFEAQPASTEIKIKTGNMKEGLYLVNFIDEHGNIRSGKFIVNH